MRRSPSPSMFAYIVYACRLHSYAYFRRDSVSDAGYQQPRRLETRILETRIQSWIPGWLRDVSWASCLPLSKVPMESQDR